MLKKVVFLDMDGVIVDLGSKFLTGTCEYNEDIFSI